MPSRYRNPYAIQTPIGQGIQSIASALASGPSAFETEIQQGQIEDARLRRAANQSIGDLFVQPQELAAQTAGLVGPEEDEGLQTVLQGLPIATARAAAPAGGLTPDMARTIYSALSQFAPEDVLRRQLPVLGQVPGKGTALTTGRADELSEQSLADAITLAQAKPVTRAPATVTPQTDEALAAMIEDMAGVRYTSAGEWDPEGAPPIEPAAMSQLLTRTSEIYQNTRNARTAADQALREMGGLSVTGEEDTSPWIPFFGDDTRQQILGGAGGDQPPVMTSLPDASAHEGRIIVDTQSGQRLKSINGQWVPAGA